MKKGFTILEMILSIALVVVLGTVSVIGFNYIKKQTYLANLDNMSNIILDAVHVYVETNSGVKNQIYSEKNGVAIPLKTLENEGLVDFKDLDIEDKYVVTMLGASGANEECVDTYTLKSWEASSGEPIYICTKSDGTKNLFAVGGEADNLSKVTRERYYFRGNDATNYIKYSDKTYRIYYVDKDDSLVLYSTSSYGNIFSGLTQNISGTGISYNRYTTPFVCSTAGAKPYAILSEMEAVSTEIAISSGDVINSSYCSGVTHQNIYYNGFDSYMGHTMGIEGNGCDSYSCRAIIASVRGYIIHLKPCMKITSGTGGKGTPYVLTKECS